MLKAYNLKSLKDMEYLKHIIPKRYTILSNKNSDMVKAIWVHMVQLS